MRQSVRQKCRKEEMLKTSAKTDLLNIKAKQLLRKQTNKPHRRFRSKKRLRTRRSSTWSCSRSSNFLKNFILSKLSKMKLSQTLKKSIGKSMIFSFSAKTQRSMLF